MTWKKETSMRGTIPLVLAAVLVLEYPWPVSPVAADDRA